MDAIVQNRTSEIIELHEAVATMLSHSLENAIRIGELITEQRLSLVHGQFLPWVEELPFSRMSAFRYMKYYQKADELKCNNVLHLSDAAKYITKSDNEVKKDEKQLRRDEDKANRKAKSSAIVHIHAGDIFDMLDEIPEQSIDVLCVDPPYGVLTDEEWDDIGLEFTEQWLSAVFPKLKDEYTGFIFTDARMMHKWAGLLGEHADILNTLIWIRKNMAKGRAIKDKYISSYEPIFYFGTRELNLKAEWGAERFDTMEFAVPQSNFNEGKRHPTQKPVELIKQLLSTGSHQGDVILDCFAGSGTTGKACQMLSIEGHGQLECHLIENNETYIEVIRDELCG